VKISILSSFALMLVTAAIAYADEPQLPPLKEGLWESHTQQVMQSNKFQTVMKLCRSHAFDKSMKASAKSTGESLRKMNQCTDVTSQISPNSFLSELNCAKDGSVTKTTVTYQGDSSYHMEMHRKDSKSESVTTIDDRYVGSCPADMKPGDAIMADGKKMSLGTP
jgi:hypothetical protein